MNLQTTFDIRDGAEPAVYRQEFAVHFSYPVFFTEDAFAPSNPVLFQAANSGGGARPHRLAVFVDAGVSAAWPGLADRIEKYVAAHPEGLVLAAPPEDVPGGEAAKNDPELIERLVQRIAEWRIDRHSYVLAIGGGAMLDAVGYAAAIAHRGVRLIRMPTTVLAQNDSGVGVKVGVNAQGVKNLVGSFAPPAAVINDAHFLDTLTERDRRAGMSEAVKVALIRDHAFFLWLERNAEALARFQPPEVAWMIRRCAELHMDQIAKGGDPFETGSARPLDFGHWAAHKLESLTGFHLRHGEAVAIGLALDTRYSVLSGMLPEGEDERVCRVLEALGFRLWDAALTEGEGSGEVDVLRGLEEFREHLGGRLTVTLLAGLGRGEEVHEMDAERVRRAIAWLEERDRARCS